MTYLSSTRRARTMESCYYSWPRVLRKRYAGMAAHILLSGTLVAGSGVPARTQTETHPDESPLMRQAHQAVSLAGHGDLQRAMSLAVQMLDNDPDFVPALNLKGMLPEQAGRGAEAGTTYEQGLKFAPNDTDLLLKSGVYKLAAGDRADAITLLVRCTRLSTPR